MILQTGHGIIPPRLTDAERVLATSVTFDRVNQVFGICPAAPRPSSGPGDRLRVTIRVSLHVLRGGLKNGRTAEQRPRCRVVSASLRNSDSARSACPSNATAEVLRSAANTPEPTANRVIRPDASNRPRSARLHRE